MAYQLIYTSAPHSLVVGRTGFSTVARTADMPEKLASAVERCGVYDVSSGEVFSHRILTYGGMRWHVLTRIVDSGVDYTNRNNYLAHHIVLSDGEVSSLANPAEILANWNGWLSSWREAPRFVGAPEGIDGVLARKSLPAKTWEKYFGKASKAALLGHSPIQIFAEVSDARTLLDLFSESLLLNTDVRRAWDVSFTTSFSRGENAADFLWKAAGQSSGAFVSAIVDLPARVAPDAPAGRAAEYAASGAMNNRERLNLSVSTPCAVRRFAVVDTKTEKTFPIFSVFAVSVGIAVAVAAVAIVFIFGGSDETVAVGTDVSEPLPIMEQPVQVSSDSVKRADTQPDLQSAKVGLVDTMRAVRELVGQDKFREALLLWRNSEYSEKYPSLETDILADIGARADTLMRYCENAFAVGGVSSPEYAKAVANLTAVRTALDIDGVPRRNVREAKWKTLNDFIKKQ